MIDAVYQTTTIHNTIGAIMPVVNEIRVVLANRFASLEDVAE